MLSDTIVLLKKMIMLFVQLMSSHTKSCKLITVINLIFYAY